MSNSITSADFEGGDGLYADELRREGLSRADSSSKDKSLQDIASSSDGENVIRDLRISGVITLSVAPGLLALAIVLGLAVAYELFAVLIGVSTLVGCIGLGLIGAAHAIAYWPRG
jgi:hypothetical protein